MGIVVCLLFGRDRRFRTSNMAALIARSTVSSLTRRGIATSTLRCADKMMADHVTGLEKRELEALQSGRDDPYEMKVYKRVAGTAASPNLVPSVADFRVIGCVCEEDATAISWMWLYKGEPKRCECGYWFKLVESKPV